MRVLPLCVLVLPLFACPFPRPQSIEVVFELREKDVSVDARFSDLRLPADELQAFQALGTVFTPDQARARVDVPWVARVDAWELVPVEGRVDLHVRATATREAFEKCLALPCGGDTPKDVCELLPLHRKCQAGIYRDLAKSDEAWVATDESTREWAPDTTKFVLALRRVVEKEDEFARPAAELLPLFADPKPAADALGWMQRLDAALEKADLRALAALDAEAQQSADPLRRLRLERLRRERDRLWYRVLSSLDPRWLQAPPAGDWSLALFGPPKSLTPRSDPPAEWKWKARACWEIGRREPEAWNELSRELCDEKWMARRKDWQRFCAAVGAAPAAAGKR